jgi:hypothetical protein
MCEPCFDSMAMSGDLEVSGATRMITKGLALKRQKVKVRVRGRRHGRCETNLVNAVLIRGMILVLCSSDGKCARGRCARQSWTGGQVQR